MAGAGLLQSPLPVVEDGSMGLRLCNSDSPFSIPGSECRLRATRHHNNKWPECNCAAAILSLTSCSSRTCKNMTPLGNQACISRHRGMLSRVLYVLKLSFLSSCINFISRSSKKKRRLLQPGRRGMLSRVQYVLKFSLLSSCISFILRS